MIHKKVEKLLKPWHMGTHLRVLNESYPIETNMTWSRKGGSHFTQSMLRREWQWERERQRERERDRERERERFRERERERQSQGERERGVKEKRDWEKVEIRENVKEGMMERGRQAVMQRCSSVLSHRGTPPLTLPYLPYLASLSVDRLPHL